MNTGASLNRGGSRQDYATPADFMEAVIKRFGVIACDLAANESNTKAQIWYGPDAWMHSEMDSLKVDWHKQRGNLWLNPPFSNISPWAQKCADESAKGARILFLTPASVGSNWFCQFVHQKANVLFLNKRIRFVGAKDDYPKDCILSCFGFGEVGYEVWRWK
jgi:phage N-6-adenine-methyltransferase